VPLAVRPKGPWCLPPTLRVRRFADEGVGLPLRPREREAVVTVPGADALEAEDLGEPVEVHVSMEYGESAVLGCRGGDQRVRSRTPSTRRRPRAQANVVSSLPPASMRTPSMFA
jgi:hypothetical protein